MNIHNEFIFICQVIPADLSIVDKRISQAGNNYANKLIQLLKPKLSISLLPIFLMNYDLSSYNDSKYVSICSNSILPYRFHVVYRLFRDTFKAFILIQKREVRNILFYNLDKQNFMLVCLVRLLLRRKTFVLVADHWSFNSSTFLERAINYILKKINGVIVLNSNIKVNVNQQLLPGLLIDDEIKIVKQNSINRNVLLSGSLGKTTGLILALECFSSNKTCDLYISGRPYGFKENEFNEIIESYTRKHQNIHFLGLLDYDSYLKLVDKCDIALSLRNPNDPEHQFNFPSKILEYLSKSKIVISSIHYRDINDDLLFNTEFNSKSLSSTLNIIFNLEEKQIMHYKRYVHKCLLSNFGSESLNGALTNLINYK